MTRPSSVVFIRATSAQALWEHRDAVVVEKAAQGEELASETSGGDGAAFIANLTFRRKQ